MTTADDKQNAQWRAYRKWCDNPKREFQSFTTAALFLEEKQAEKKSAKTLQEYTVTLDSKSTALHNNQDFQDLRVKINAARAAGA